MRIHRRRKRGQEARSLKLPEYQVNDDIKADVLFLILDDGEKIGETSREKALQMAAEQGKDLVVVAPKANPPVAKFLDYGQFKYQKEKEARKNKAASRQTETKAIRLSARIGKHDMDVRMKRALDFFKKGDKVKLEIVLRGREKAHGERGHEVMKEFIKKALDEHGIEVKIEQEFKRQGSRLSMVIGQKQVLPSEQAKSKEKPKKSAESAE